MDEDKAGYLIVGLKGYGLAPTSRAVCNVCNRRIPAGHLRLQYRFKASFKLSDERYVHGTCARGLPEPHRAKDISDVEAWVAAEADPAVKEQLQATLRSLRGDAAGSADGG